MAAIDSIFTSEHTARPATPPEVFAALPADVLNAVTAQRDELAAQIENAEDLRDLKAAEKSFRLVRDLWHALGYGYKVAEARDRLIGKARRLANGLRQMAHDEPAKRHVARDRLFVEANKLNDYADEL